MTLTAPSGRSRTISPSRPAWSPSGAGGAATEFQWIETATGEVTLMALATNRFLRIAPDGAIRADSPGPRPDGEDGTRLRFVATG